MKGFKKSFNGLKKFGFVSIAAFTFLFASCENELYQDFGKSVEDPSDEGITVESYKDVQTVYLSWNQDEACESYVLYRMCENEVTPVFEKIYSGKECSYKDSGLTDSCTYVYRLDKIRGKKTFTGTKYGFGVCSSVVNDEY